MFRYFNRNYSVPIFMQCKKYANLSEVDELSLNESLVEIGMLIEIDLFRASLIVGLILKGENGKNYQKRTGFINLIPN
jgi:hypothetical protein